MKSLKRLFAIQRRWSVLPHSKQLLIERIKTRGGHQLFVFPFEARFVHEGLAALLAYRISRVVKTTFTLACNDYGLVLQSPHRIEIEQMIASGLWNTDQLIPDILSSLNSTEMAKRQFRQIARVAGLIHPGYPGQRKSTSHVQASSNLFFDVFCQLELQLLSQRAIYWPKQETLFVADTHFSKDATFRRHGLPVPKGSTSATLETLSQLLDATAARHLVILGDMFHARSSLSGDVCDAVSAFCDRHAYVGRRLVRGNHDARRTVAAVVVDRGCRARHAAGQCGFGTSSRAAAGRS